MFIPAQEWSKSQSSDLAKSPTVLTHQLPGKSANTGFADIYKVLSIGKPDELTKQRAARFLCDQIAAIEEKTCGLPDAPEELDRWMRASAETATAKYGVYLQERKAGAPRRFFSSRAHALFFLRAVSPTKLVDGAWLYGLLAHWRNPRFSSLLRIYLEELGGGVPDKNHVVLYRQLLERNGLELAAELEEMFYVQGTIQLALAFNAEEFLPEVIGFNLGYEQLPLHLLVTAYELDELGLDSYYFTLHITVDNLDTGHAKRAVQGVVNNLPRIGNAGDFWRRVRNGAKLADAGITTIQVIETFDIKQEVIRIFSHKSQAGQGAHSNYCKVAGRSINDWLGNPEEVPEFLQALQRTGWIKLGRPVSESRFWRLLQGERAEMFGVFSSYELQVIHDWIRGEESADGRAYDDPPKDVCRPSFRVATRLAAARGESFESAIPVDGLLDVDLHALKSRLDSGSEKDRNTLMIEAMAPSHHWTPAGLYATHLFCKQLL